jgi:cytochrome c oxidase subunit 4
MARELRSLILVWAALMALLALTVGVTFSPLGPWRAAASLTIAAAKAALIAWIYMDLRREPGLTRLAAAAALVLLAVLIGLAGLDAYVRTHSI